MEPFSECLLWAQKRPSSLRIHRRKAVTGIPVLGSGQSSSSAPCTLKLQKVITRWIFKVSLYLLLNVWMMFWSSHEKIPTPEVTPDLDPYPLRQEKPYSFALETNRISGP